MERGTNGGKILFGSIISFSNTDMNKSVQVKRHGQGASQLYGHHLYNNFLNPSNAEATFALLVQECKNLWKPSKPYLVGTHWKALTEYSQMSTHLPEFQCFFRFFAFNVLAKLATTSIRFKNHNAPKYFHANSIYSGQYLKIIIQEVFPKLPSVQRTLAKVCRHEWVRYMHSSSKAYTFGSQAALNKESLVQFKPGNLHERCCLDLKFF